MLDGGFGVIIAVVALATIVGLLLLLREREQSRHERHTADLLLGAALERQSLAERIQHPETRQVPPGEVIEHEVPTDAGELAQVGQIVYGNPDNGSEG